MEPIPPPDELLDRTEPIDTHPLPPSQIFDQTEPMEPTPPPDLPSENLTEPNLWNRTPSQGKI